MYFRSALYLRLCPLEHSYGRGESVEEVAAIIGNKKPTPTPLNETKWQRLAAKALTVTTKELEVPILTDTKKCVDSPNAGNGSHRSALEHAQHENNKRRRASGLEVQRYCLRLRELLLLYFSKLRIRVPDCQHSKGRAGSVQVDVPKSPPVQLGCLSYSNE
uniref:Uncharacterized protein n=1 Tax=Physcomitrium patens TaxID=3218 RepID=A0A2K1ITS0_PHYPA|nr:hypothetical protein PHYPA_024614 [Physcomitrium patens]